MYYKDSSVIFSYKDKRFTHLRNIAFLLFLRFEFYLSVENNDNIVYLFIH